MNKAEEKAIDAWAIYEYREHPKGLYHTCFVDGYKEGYQQAEKEAVERVIEWLIAHADDYIVDMEVNRYKPSKLHVGGMCWEHLKQAMEEK